MPQFSNSNTNPALTQAALASAQRKQSFAYDRLVSKVSVSSVTGTYALWDLQNRTGALPPGDGSTSSQYEEFEMSNKGQFHAADIDLSTATFSCTQHGLEVELTDRLIENGRSDLGVDYPAEASAAVMERLLIARDKLVEGLLNDSSNFTSTAPTAWNNASSDLAGDISTAVNTIRNATGVARPNLTLFCGGVVMDALRESSELGTWADTQNQSMGLQDGSDESLERFVRSYLGIKDVIGGWATKANMREGQTNATTAVHGDYAILGYFAGGASTDSILVDFERVSPSISEVRNPKDLGPTIRAWDDHKLVVPRYAYGYHFQTPGS